MLLAPLAAGLGPLLVSLLLPPAAEATVRAYPKPPLSDVVDDYHGTKVPDPYRALEDVTAPATRAWIDAENRLTEAYLAAIPGREPIRELLEGLSRQERVSTPVIEGGRYFYTRGGGLFGQPPVIVQEGPGGKARTLLDPTSLRPGGNAVVTGWVPSRDGKRLAYGVATGADGSEWRVRDVDSGKDLPDVLPGARGAVPAWTADGTGLYVARPSEKGSSLLLHTLGAVEGEDQVVLEAGGDPERLLAPAVSDDGRLLAISVAKGTDRRTGLYVKELGVPGSPVVRLYEPLEARTDFVASDGLNLILLRADGAAPRGRLVTVDLARARQLGRPVATELVPQPPEGVLVEASVVAGKLLVRQTVNASDRILIHSLSGKRERVAELPALGTVSGLAGRRSDRATFFTFSSFLYPPTVYLYDPVGDLAVPFLKPAPVLDPTLFETRQELCRSKDGARVPIFLVHRKGLKLDGRNPTLLYGYGGFGVSMTPAFSARHVAFVLMGGVFAQACVRGGGEYGREWHDAGRLARKQNSFDDFAAAARWLIDGKVTSPARLAIAGGSNGGLLVAATLNQHPDLFGAAVPAVGVMDMLRYQRFTVGWSWASDYGTSADPEQFRWLHAYSPLHNLKPGTSYPPVLIVTSDHDDRVVPGHSFKYAAALQAAQAGDAPILIRIETRGAPAGKAADRQIAESTDVLSFLAHALGGLTAGGR